MGFEYNSIERALLTTNISDTAYECSRDACLAMLLGGSGEPPSAPFMSNADEGPVQSLMDLTGCDAREAASALERCNANVSEAAELLFRDLEDLESELAALRIADLETVRVSERTEAEARDAALAEELEARERQALGNGACCTALASDAALAAELAMEMHAEGGVASDAALAAELATEMHAEEAVASDAALAAELEAQMHAEARQHRAHAEARIADDEALAEVSWRLSMATTASEAAEAALQEHSSALFAAELAEVDAEGAVRTERRLEQQAEQVEAWELSVISAREERARQLGAVSSELSARHLAYAHARQRSIINGYAERVEVATLKLHAFMGDDSQRVLDLSRLSAPGRARIEALAAELSSASSMRLQCTVDHSGPDPVLRIRKRTRPPGTALPAATPAKPPTAPPAADRLAASGESLHLPNNSHVSSAGYTRNLRVVGASNASPKSLAAASAETEPSSQSCAQSTAAAPQPQHQQLRPPAPPFGDVPLGVWCALHELPFRVKYEVEVLVGLKKMVRWALLPEAFVHELLKCVAEDGEAVCVSVLRKMQAEPLQPVLDWFRSARESCSTLRYVNFSPGVLHQRPLWSTLRTVEVLRAVHCCPSGRTIARPAEYQSSNRVLRLVGDLYGTDHLLRVSFVNDGVHTPITLRGLHWGGGEATPAAARATIARCWRERRLARRGGSQSVAARSSDLDTVQRPHSTFQVPHSKWEAVSSALRDGLCVGGELFRWLAPSASQMKKGGMWFVRESELNAALLRRCLGDFSKLATPALYLARLGQCLSSTYVSRTIQQEEAWDIEEVEDVVSESGEIFSDGAGFCSYKLLQLLFDSLHRPPPQSSDPPHLQTLLERPGSRLPYSAVQVRCGGRKGVVALRMGTEGRVLYTRPSMHKFDASIRELEVCEWATWHAGYLNRPLVALLEHRGVPYAVLERYQSQYLRELSQCLTSQHHAERLLSSLVGLIVKGGEAGVDGVDGSDGDACGGPLGTALTLLRHGVPLEEPFVAGLLRCIRASLVRGVVDKARVLVPEAATLIGVMDEEGVLEYGEVFLQVQPPDAPDDAGPQVIEQNVAVYRSPGKHPGDVLVLRAVHHPALCHLINVVVFPRVGPRPHPSELSSGDLDGDKYLVIWAPSIVDSMQPAPPVPPPADLCHRPAHKQPTAKPAYKQPTAKAFARGMPPLPPPPPSEHALLQQVAQWEVAKAAKPQPATLGDFLARSAPRRRGLSEGEMASHGKILEAAREARAEERRQRFQIELMRRIGVAEDASAVASAVHQQRLERAAIRWYIFFGQRNNVGTISNTWLVYADRCGVDHPETLELCRLAQLAVHFVKTGEPVELDPRRFPPHAARPDFMVPSHTGSGEGEGRYVSQRALGKLHRAAVEATTAEATPAAAADALVASSLLAQQLHAAGFEVHLPAARAARDAYNEEVAWHLAMYGVATEAELLSGRVVAFEHDWVATDDSQEAEEALRRSIHALWAWARRRFRVDVEAAVRAAPPADDESGGGGTGESTATLRQRMTRQVAYAWYSAGKWLGEEPPINDRLTLHSFAWVAWPLPYL